MEDDFGGIEEDDRSQEDRKKMVRILGQTPVEDARDITLQDHQMENPIGRQEVVEGEENVPDMELTPSSEEVPGEIIFAPWTTTGLDSAGETNVSKEHNHFVKIVRNDGMEDKLMSQGEEGLEDTTRPPLLS